MSKLGLLFSICGAGLLSFGVAGCGQLQDERQVNSEIMVGPTKYLTPAEVRQHIINAGFTGSQVKTMLCLAYAESSFDTLAHSYAGARGLFQIMPFHAGATCPGISLEALWNPAANAKCARRVFLAQGFNAWDPYYYAQPEHYSYRHAHNYVDCMNGKVKLD